MTCSLEGRALARQLGRFERIGRHALSAVRGENQVTLELGAGLDEALLRETLAIESACCPFFALRWDAGTRMLTIAAPDDRREMLDLLAGALDVA
jgi:hypothetical protein